MEFQNFDEENSVESSPNKEHESLQIYGITTVMDDSKLVIRKLLCVAAICLIFMMVEVAGGFIANSLAIMTDAAHLFSDISGFFISIFSLLIGQIQATEKMSFGYFRAEIIGAMSSVVLIWGLTIWLVYEAIGRIIHPEEVRAEIMLITACLGLLFNIVMMKVLHGSSHGGHDHGHDHGFTQSQNFNPIAHDHDHKSEQNIKTQQEGDHKSHNEHDHKSLNKHNHGEPDNHHSHAKCNEQDHLHDTLHDHQHERTQEQTQNQNQQNPDINFSTTIFQPIGQNNSIDPVLENKVIQNQDRSNEPSPDPVDINQVGKTIDSHLHHEHGDHGHGDHGHGDHGHGNHGHGDHENMNIRAALVHLIGDTVQSVGVIIAAVVIFFRPEWALIDPICTFLFSVIVVFTTIPITKDCLSILMESTPRRINHRFFKSEILALPNVESIHKLHIWSITSNKIALSAHIRTTTPSQTLKQAQAICQKYKIQHSTIQVENPNDDHLFNSLECEQKPS